MTRRKIDLVFFDAGGGHRNAMRALAEVLGKTRPQWHVEPVNLQQLLLSVDPVFLTTRIKSENIYNAALARGWTRSSRPFLRALQRAIRLQAPVMERKLIEHWRKSRPDMVVSLVPNFNGVMFQALRAIDPKVPYVTIMTDLADTPPHFWQEPQDQHLICGSAKAFLQAHLTGWYRPERILKTSGMILSPSFYDDPRAPLLSRASLGLDAQMTTALIMFGGNGSAVSTSILDQLEASGLPVQSIVLCGRNEKLRASLAGRPRCHALGFTDRVADYMRLSDLFIGKPGPGSMSEALHMGLPVIVESNARTLVQERYNILWAEEQGVGLALSSFAEIDKALRYLLSGSTLESYRARAAALKNTAVFEIPDMLEEILASKPADDRPFSASLRAKAVLPA
jgi:1,2-diacylglycerol 3-beta-galactosyltransferase